MQKKNFNIVDKIKIWFGNKFIPPDICTNKKEILPALEYIPQWISESDENFMTILGDFGAGKTTLVNYLVSQWRKAFQKDRLHYPEPILISLHDVRENTLKTIITDHLHSHGPNVSYAQFELMLRSGQVILLFDDLYEITNLLWFDPCPIFEELMRLAEQRSKVILTCSEQDFKIWQEQAKTIDGELLVEIAPLYHVQRQYWTRQHLVHLQLFDDAKIKAYLQLTCPKQVATDWDKIECGLAKHPLHPFLLDMIVKVLPKFDNLQSITVAKVYEYYTNQWLQPKKNCLWFQQKEKHLLSSEHRLQLLLELAWEMWNSQENDLTVCGTWLMRERLNIDESTMICELQTVTFLKNKNRILTFLHHSFIEYLVAYKIYAGLAKADIRILKTRRLDRQVIFFLTQLAPNNQFKALLENRLTNAYWPQISENALQIWYWSQRIAAGMAEKITDLTKLQQWLQLPSYVQLQNAQLADIILEVATLPQAQLKGASLFNANLNNSNFYGSDLRQVDLTAATCLKANFQECDLTQAQLQQVDFKEAILPADLRNKPQIDDLPARESLVAVVQRLHPQKEDTITIYNPDDARFAIRCHDGIIQIWRSANYRLLYTLEKPQGNVESVLFEPNSAGFASGSLKQRMKPLTFPKTSHHTIYSVAFDPNHAQLASGGNDGKIRLWDLNSGKLLHTFDGHCVDDQIDIWSVAFDPIHAQLANTMDGRGNKVQLWDLNSKKLLHWLYGGHSRNFRSVAFDPNHAQLAVGGDDKRGVLLLDSNSGEVLRTLKGFTVRSVVFDPNHAWLASCGFEVDLWDSNSGKWLYTLEGHRGDVNSVAFDPNHARLASGGDDGTVRLWDPNLGKLLHILEAHTGEVLSVAFDPKRARLASGSADRTVRLWESQTGKCLAVLNNHLGRVESVAFAPNGRYLVAAGSAGRLQFWDLDTYETFLYLYSFGRWSWLTGWLALLPDGRFNANSEGMRYLCYTEKGTFNSYRAKELVKEFYDPEGVKAVLAKYNSSEY